MKVYLILLLFTLSFSLDEDNHKWVYTYGAGKAEGDRTMRNLLGGKGVGLHDMCSIGVPVPPGFTITTEVCTYYYDHDKQYPKRLAGDVQAGMKHIENIVGKKFGDEADPLLVSVRSGARVSMPGMMDTILNLGLNDKTVVGLHTKTGLMTLIEDSSKCLVILSWEYLMLNSKRCFKESRIKLELNLIQN